MLNEIQNSIFGVNGGLFYTIKELFKRPGTSIRDFVEGKRVKHFKPVAYVLILSIIYSFLEHKINNNPFIEEGLLGIVDALENARDLSEEKVKIFEWFIHNYSYTALLLIPVFSFSSFLAFKKSDFNYLEHVVLNTFLFGQITLIFLLTIPLSLIFPTNSTIEIVRIIISVVFTFIAYYQFFDGLKKHSRIINTVFTYSFFLFFLLLLLIPLIGIAIL
ncbi:MAG: DUF3667 domain-containing protein [Mongoliitalea sp.]